MIPSLVSRSRPVGPPVPRPAGARGDPEPAPGVRRALGMPAALLALLLALPVAAQDAYESHFLDSDGVRLHYIDEGAGEPVLLIHGLAVSVAVNWAGAGVVDGLVDAGYRVVAYDGRGHGFSEKPHDPELYGPVEIEDAIRLLDHLGIDRAHVVGYSRGGFLASHLRARHPERVRTLTLGGYGDNLQGEPPANPIPAAEIADSLAAGSLGPLVRWVDPGATPDQVEALGRMVSEANDLEAVRIAFLAMGRLPPVSPDDLAATEVPVQAVVGDLDVMRDEVERMAAAVDGMEVLVLPGAAHTDAFARPEFMTALVGFLGKQGHAPGR